MNTHITKRAVAALLLACSAFTGLVSPAFAQQPYPNRQVMIVVPIGPGTEVDWSARAYAQKLSDMWKVPVVVENRVGAGGGESVSDRSPSRHRMVTPCS